MTFRAAANSNSRALLLGENYTNVNMRNTRREQGTASEQTRMMLEEQNNEEINALSQKVSQMRMIADDIESQIKDDNELLTKASSSFDQVTSMMKGTLGNVQQMLNTGGSKHMCYLVAFVVCLFLGLYWLMK